MALPAAAMLQSRASQVMTLAGFVGFQLMDALTTHLGLGLDHPELNRVMAPIIATDGELVAYAIKGTAVAVLLALLMLGSRRIPRIWHVYQVAAILTALAVLANVYQLL
jgi:uncharacterized protein DUF5658